MIEFLWAVVALLAAVGLMFGSAVFVEWLRGGFTIRPRKQTTWASPTSNEDAATLHYVNEAALRDQARFEALTRIEERELQRGAESDSPAETVHEAATILPTPPEPVSVPLVRADDPEREAARAAALARIAERAKEVAREAEVKVATGEEARALREEIERRAAKVAKTKPRPGVRSIKEYDFEKPLRDDLPRSGMPIDPLDLMKGYQ